MLDGVTVYHLSPPDPACALSHLSAKTVCAHALSLPAAQALGSSSDVLWVWGTRELGWCVSPVTLPERVLVVLCGQEKPQLFISSKACFTLWATVFCTYTGWGERGTLTGRGVCMPHAHPPSVQESDEFGTAARATRGFTNCFKSCEEQLLPISWHLHLLEFESGSDFLHPYGIAHATEVIFFPILIF